MPSSTRYHPPETARRLLLGATAVSLILNFVPGAEVVSYPIRLFATIVHEGGHALATILTGGSVEFIKIVPNCSGVTWSQGGWPSLVYMAGYIGATAFGAGCLQLIRRKNAGRTALGLMAAVVLVITTFFIHPWTSLFGFLAGIFVAGVLILGARMLPVAWAQFVAAFLGVQLSLNALYDIRTLLYATSFGAEGNDAVFMAQAYGLSPVFWAALWALGSILIMGTSLRSYWQSK